MFGFLLSFLISLNPIFGLVQKETTLNAQITSKNGASIIHNQLTAHVSGTDYNVIVDTKDDIGYDIKLSLNKSWSFQPSIVSCITLTINGNTPYPHIDTDFMLVFSVNNLQYLSFFVHLDNTHNIKSRIYPSLSRQNIADIEPVSEWISNNAILSRWDRISNNGQWVSSNWNKQALWPLKFVIINDPITNEIIFEFYDQITQQYETGFVFNESSFVPNKHIDVYIMGDSNGERYNLSSLNIVLSSNDSNINNPTVTHTNQPTLSVTNAIVNYVYGISVIVSFEYIFSVEELDKIIIILQDSTMHRPNINNCVKWVKQTIVRKGNMTTINATIFFCDELTQNELLTAVIDGDLKYEIIKDINQQLPNRTLQINSNKTRIQANRLHIFHNNSTNTTDLSNILVAAEADETDKRRMYYYSFWMIIFITIPIIACCLFLSYLKVRVEQKENQQIAQLQHVNLSLQIENISKIQLQESDEEQTEDCMRQNSSKLYKLRRYNKPINNNAKQQQPSIAIPTPQSPQSPQSAVSPRTYKTRGISEDMYDVPNGETCSNDLYGEGNMNIITLHPKLSMSSRINTNPYPNVSSPTSPDQTTKRSANYKLPQYHVTKRQWL